MKHIVLKTTDRVNEIQLRNMFCLGMLAEIYVMSCKQENIIVESLLKSVEAFILGLPPLLQMLLGIFAMIGLIKLFMFSVDLIEDRREGKK